MKKILSTSFLTLLIAVLALAFTGCEDAGDNMEDAVDETGDAMEDAGDEIEDAVN